MLTSKIKNTNTPALRFPEFKGEWEQKLLADVCSNFRAGKGITSESIFKTGKYPVYGGNGVRGYTEEFNCEGDYVLIGRQGALCGNINYIKGKNYVSEHAIIIDKTDISEIKWLNYKLTGMRLGRLSESSAQPGLAVEKLKKLKILIPSDISEQNKIGTFLTIIDERIATQSKIIEELKLLKDSLSKKIFSKQIRFQDEKGESFPEWDTKRLIDVSRINPKSEILPKSFIYIDLESVEKGHLKKAEHIDKEIAPSRAQRLLQKDDILYQMIRPYQRNNLFFQNDDTDYVASTGYAQIRAQCNPMFLYHALHTDTFVNKVIERCTGTSYPAINSTDLSNITIEIPVISEQIKIADFLTVIDKKIDGEGKLLQQYYDQKKYLLKNLFI